jgi:hypothetical protein
METSAAGERLFGHGALSRTDATSEPGIFLPRDAPNGEDAVFSQVLYRNDGRPLGMIVRYYEDAPTYACVRVGVTNEGDRFVFDAKRLGAMSTDQAARAAVERALEQGEMRNPHEL